MTAPALIKQAELRRMATIAKREGVRVEVEVGGRVFRVSPDIPDIPSDQNIAKKEPVRL